MDVTTSLSWNLNIGIFVLFCILLEFLLWDFPFSYICLVAHQKNKSILPTRLNHEVQPFVYPFQRCTQTNIDHNETGIRVPYVGGDKSTKTLLSCGVPQLQSQCLALYLHRLRHEVDPDCRLPDTTATLEVNSKESWMNRDIMEVFPTFWSPTRTTLNLLSFGIIFFE